MTSHGATPQALRDALGPRGFVSADEVEERVLVDVLGVRGEMLEPVTAANVANFVIPAKAGIQRPYRRSRTCWAPAFAGATRVVMPPNGVEADPEPGTNPGVMDPSWHARPPTSVVKLDKP